MNNPLGFTDFNSTTPIQFNNIPKQDPHFPAYSSWRPDANDNNDIIIKDKISSNWEYRRFLQNNAKVIIPLNNEIELEETLNHDYYDKSKLINNVLLYKNCLDIKQVDLTKLPYSDLKQQYMKSYEEQCRSVCPKFSI